MDEQLNENYKLLQSFKLTIEELREQFEEYERQFYNEPAFYRPMNGKYLDELTENLWQSYLRCASINNVLKEGEIK